LRETADAFSPRLSVAVLGGFVSALNVAVEVRLMVRGGRAWG
jgi:hypothetical protein